MDRLSHSFSGLLSFASALQLGYLVSSLIVVVDYQSLIGFLKVLSLLHVQQCTFPDRVIEVELKFTMDFDYFIVKVEHQTHFEVEMVTLMDCFQFCHLSLQKTQNSILSKFWQKLIIFSTSFPFASTSCRTLSQTEHFFACIQ